MAYRFASSFKASTSKIAFGNRLLKPLVDPPPLGLNHRVTSSLPFCTRPIYDCTRSLFDSWCKEYERSYSSDEEKEYRYKLFKKKCKQINKHNADPKSTYSTGLTMFADITRDEFLNTYAWCSRPSRLALEYGQVIEIHSQTGWKKLLQEGVESEELVVVEFMKPWCKKCCSIAPKLAKIAKATSDVIFVKIFAHELKTLADEYKVEVVPTFVFLKDGNEVDRIVGANIKDLQRKLDQHGAVAL